MNYNIEVYTYTIRKEQHGTRIYKKVIKEKIYTIKNVDKNELSQRVIQFQKQQRLVQCYFEFIKRG